MTSEQFKKILDMADNKQQTLVIHTDEDQRAVVVPFEEYEALMATLEEASDPTARKALKDAQDDIAHGRLYSYEEVFGAS